MIKINFSQIFNNQSSQQHLNQQNITKLLETDIGTQTPIQQSFLSSNNVSNNHKNNQTFNFNQERIFIQDQQDQYQTINQDIKSNSNININYQSINNNYFNYDNTTYYKNYFPNNTLDNSFNNSLNNSFQSMHAGNRLYYKNKQNHKNKLLDCQRKRLEQQLKVSQQCSFKPQINKKSVAIIEKKQKKFQQQQKLNQFFTIDDLIIQQRKNLNQSKKETHLNHTIGQLINISKQKAKQFNQLAQCTFTPQLISKSTRNKQKQYQSFNQVSNHQSTTNKTKPYENLYNLHKVKQYKKKVQLAQQRQKLKQSNKRISKTQLSDFLQRNTKFIEKKQKKKQLLSLYSNTHNLDNGKKYFHPKLNQNTNEKYVKKWEKQQEKQQQSKLEKKTVDDHYYPNPQSAFKSRRSIQLRKVQEVVGENQEQIHIDE